MTRTRVAPREPATIDPASVAVVLEQLAAKVGAGLVLEPLGRSFLGRPIQAATIGHGPQRVLAWSQMHGDEPTHTAVLLDLLAWLAAVANGEAADEDAATILSGVTLSVVPLLNPDGAVLGRRENAQGIDVNRDARRLASPEGRMLRAAVERFRPDFAFNLHNQNARSTVGRSKRPSVVALMAPPLDFGCPETEQIVRAKRVAVCFRRAVEPLCPGMISRYSAEFMPRAFGERLQAAGVTTVLVEAGGSPDDVNFDMAGLHLHGLAQTLAAIARDELLTADPAEYDALPLDGEIVRFDGLVHQATVVRGASAERFAADLGINFPGGRRLATGPLVCGVIDEIGDLEVTAGKQELDATGLCCVPGQWEFDPNLRPTAIPAADALRAVTAQGVTSLVGTVDATSDAELAALGRLAAATEPIAALNLGFAATLPTGASGSASELARRILLAVHRGACAIDDRTMPAEVLAALSEFDLPRLSAAPLAESSVELRAASLDELAERAAAWACAMRQSGRGRIDKGAIADLALFAPAEPPATAALVLVGGRPVAAGALSGTLLRLE
ncbi:MAG: hypothetical protein KF847_01940 [Pirellulales bacterium]|nr:hypothetical protein [Pirellulales bacterium]